MKYEFHAEYPFALKDSVTQAFAIEWLVDKSSRLPHSWQAIGEIKASFQRVMLLSQAVLTAYKEQARMGTRREAGGLQFWLTKKAEAFLTAQLNLMRAMALLPECPEVRMLPSGSWSLHLTFTLRKPYLSRDDTGFYLLDNPVKKEWLFKVPYVAPSQWKGALRAAMMQELAQDLRSGQIDAQGFVEKRLQLYRLFGNEKDGSAQFLNRVWALHRVDQRPDGEREGEEREEKLQHALEQVSEEFESALRDRHYRMGDVEGFQGHLRFYPTFFSQISLEVINPHDRSTGAGKQPIYFECVPAGATGEFALLYVPLEGVGEEEALDDLRAVAAGLRAMLTRYGFGAKTSSGYGVAEIGSGEFTVAMVDPALSTPQESGKVQEASITREIEEFVQRFNLDEFPRWTNEELRASGWGKKRQSKYKQVRRKHPDWDEETHTWRPAVEAKSEIEPPVRLVKREFDGEEAMEQKIAELRRRVGR